MSIEELRAAFIGRCKNGIGCRTLFDHFPSLKIPGCTVSPLPAPICPTSPPVNCEPCSPELSKLPQQNCECQCLDIDLSAFKPPTLHCPEMLPCPVQPVAGPSTDLGQKLEVVVDSALLSGIASPEATSRGCLRQSRSRRRSRFVPMPISQAPSSSLVKYKIFMISIRYSQSFVLVYFYLLRLT